MQLLNEMPGQREVAAVAEVIARRAENLDLGGTPGLVVVGAFEAFSAARSGDDLARIFLHVSSILVICC